MYKRRFPKRNLHQTAIDVLRLPDEQWHQVLDVADQFSGGALHWPEVKRPKGKVKPSSYKTIASLQDKSTLAYLLHLERAAHNDHSKDFHEGGGLWDATKSIFKGLWNTVGLGPEFDRWFGTFDYESPQNKLSSNDTGYAKMIQQSYKSADERDDTVDDWVRDQTLDSDRFTTWVEEDTGKVHVAIRGTKAKMQDVFSDLGILLTNQSGIAHELRDYMKLVEDKYDDYSIEASGHSLGGNQLINISDDAKLSRINLFNPGVSPLWITDRIKNIAEDPRTHLFLNSGDTISNTMISYVDDNDNVKWSQATHNPIGNHSISQWVGDESEK